MESDAQLVSSEFPIGVRSGAREGVLCRGC